LHLAQCRFLGGVFPFAQERDRVALHIVVDEFGAVLAQPDPVIDGPAFLGGQAGVVARAAFGRGGDVGSDTDVEGLRGVLLGAAGELPTVRVRAAVSYSLGECLFGLEVEIVSHGNTVLADAVGKARTFTPGLCRLNSCSDHSAWGSLAPHRVGAARTRSFPRCASAACAFPPARRRQGRWPLLELQGWPVSAYCLLSLSA